MTEEFFLRYVKLMGNMVLKCDKAISYSYWVPISDSVREYHYKPAGFGGSVKSITTSYEKLALALVISYFFSICCYIHLWKMLPRDDRWRPADLIKWAKPHIPVRQSAGMGSFFNVFVFLCESLTFNYVYVNLEI